MNDVHGRQQNEDAFFIRLQHQLLCEHQCYCPAEMSYLVNESGNECYFLVHETRHFSPSSHRNSHQASSIFFSFLEYPSAMKKWVGKCKKCNVIVVHNRCETLPRLCRWSCLCYGKLGASSRDHSKVLGTRCKPVEYPLSYKNEVKTNKKFSG